MLFIPLTGLLLRAAMLLIPKSYWADEWFHIELALLPLQETFRQSLHDVHPPLSFILLHLCALVFGTAEASIRSVSFLSGIGMLFFGIKLCRRLLPHPASAWASLFLAWSAYALQTSNEVRGYSLHGFLAVAAAYGALRWIRDGRSLWAYGTFIAAMLALYTEHLAWLWIAGLWLWLFRWRLKTSLLFLLLAAPSMALVAYQAVYRERSFDMERLGAFYHIPSLIKKAAGVIWHFAFGYIYAMLPGDPVLLVKEATPLFILHGVCTLAVTAALFVGLRRALSANRDLAWFFLAFFVFPCVFLFVIYPIRFESRYLPFALPVFFMMLAYGLNTRPSGPLRHTLIALIAGLNLYAGLYTIGLSTDSIHKEDHRELVRHLSAAATSKDAIVNHDLAIGFYSKRMGLPVAAKVYANHARWQADGRGLGERVFVVGYRNMHPDVTRRILSDLAAQMALNGYVPDGDPAVFGGDHGLLFALRFRPAGS